MSMDTELFSLMRDWGYFLLPKKHAESPGYPGVYVAIRQTPTEEHFDPESIEARLCNGQGSVERRRLQLHMHGELPHRVCPGRLTLYDRFNKRVDFYTFGAQMMMDANDEMTIYTFTSSAPILLLAEDADNFPEQFEAETEGLLAGIHVAWARDDASFYRRLGEIEPAVLYAASLRTVFNQYAAYPSLRERFPRFYRRLYNEFQWYKEQNPDFPQGPPLVTVVGTPTPA